MIWFSFSKSCYKTLRSSFVQNDIHVGAYFVGCGIESYLHGWSWKTNTYKGDIIPRLALKTCTSLLNYWLIKSFVIWVDLLSYHTIAALYICALSLEKHQLLGLHWVVPHLCTEAMHTHQDFDTVYPTTLFNWPGVYFTKVFVIIVRRYHGKYETNRKIDFVKGS